MRAVLGHDTDYNQTHTHTHTHTHTYLAEERLKHCLVCLRHWKLPAVTSRVEKVWWWWWLCWTCRAL